MYNQSFSSVSYSTQIANPSVHLAVNGNRIKTYYEDGETRAYLKDGTEFQLEFYNDSDSYVKAEIIINGKSQNSALVLRPYQHFYLDRFMDEKTKFKFNTFLTGNDDIEKLKEIIAKNGRIEVKFYREFVPLPVTWTTYTTGTYTNYATNTSTGDNIKYRKSIINESDSSTGQISLDSNAQASLSSPRVMYAVSNEAKEIETGRIESGNKSNQDFNSVYKTWDFYTCAEFAYHIMPESHRPKPVKVKKQKNVVQADDIRTYCGICGRRLKKGYNFCPGCGNKF